MIEFRNVSKSYLGDQGHRLALRNVTFRVENKSRLAILCRNDQSRTALINLMSGRERPDVGEVARIGRVSFPIGRGLAVDPNLTGAEISRHYAHVYHSDPVQVEAFCYDAAELGSVFFQPFKGYSSGRRARLKLALVLALNFQIHLIDEGIPTGKRAAQPEVARMLERRLEHTGVVLFTENPANAFMRRFCDHAAVLAHGELTDFDNLLMAKAHYRNVA